MATPAARPAKVIQRVLSLDREADAILHEDAPTKKAHGRFLSRLIYENRARQETRKEMRAAMRQERADRDDGYTYEDIAKAYGLPQKGNALVTEKG